MYLYVIIIVSSVQLYCSCLGNKLLCYGFSQKAYYLINFFLEHFLSTGSLLGSSCGEVGLSNVTTNSLLDWNAEGKKLPDHSLVRCSKSQNKRPQIASNFSETTVVEVETIVQNELFGSCSERFVQHTFMPWSCKISSVWIQLQFSDYIFLILYRNVGEQTSDTTGSLEFTPQKSEVTESNGFCITPGSIVWAKTACQTWWPAEVCYATVFWCPFLLFHSFSFTYKLYLFL